MSNKAITLQFPPSLLHFLDSIYGAHGLDYGQTKVRVTGRLWSDYG